MLLSSVWAKNQTALVPNVMKPIQNKKHEIEIWKYFVMTL